MHTSPLSLLFIFIYKKYSTYPFSPVSWWLFLTAYLQCFSTEKYMLLPLLTPSHNMVLSGFLRGKSVEQFHPLVVENNLDKYKDEPCSKSYLANRKHLDDNRKHWATLTSQTHIYSPYTSVLCPKLHTQKYTNFWIRKVQIIFQEEIQLLDLNDTNHHNTKFTH